MKKIYTLLGVMFVFIIIDFLSAYGIFYYLYLNQNKEFNTESFHYTPAVSLGTFLFNKASLLLQNSTSIKSAAIQIHGTQYSDPSPFFTQDALLGYAPNAGKYQLFFTREDKEKIFRWKATILEDRCRASSDDVIFPEHTLYIYGDSFVFGWGVDDENTFGWHLQEYLRNKGWLVKIFAHGGYATIHSLIWHRENLHKIREGDIIIVGYNEFYKDRNVSNPSRILAMHKHMAKLKKGYSSDVQHPRGKLVNDRLEIDYVFIDCDKNDGYCNKEDVSDEIKSSVTIAMLKEIINSTKAKVYILFMGGTDEDPVIEYLKSNNIPIIDARLEKSEFFIRDDIYGYDAHPGPLSHLYWYRLIRQAVAFE